MQTRVKWGRIGRLIFRRLAAAEPAMFPETEDRAAEKDWESRCGGREIARGHRPDDQRTHDGDDSKDQRFPAARKIAHMSAPKVRAIESVDRRIHRGALTAHSCGRRREITIDF